MPSPETQLPSADRPAIETPFIGHKEPLITYFLEADLACTATTVGAEAFATGRQIIAPGTIAPRPQIPMTWKHCSATRNPEGVRGIRKEDRLPNSHGCSSGTRAGTI